MAVTDQGGRFNIFQVLILGVMIASGLGALALIRPTTLLGSVAVLVLGCSVPVVAYRLFETLAANREPLPICHNGRCDATKYRIERRAEEGDYYRCSCGDLYLLSPDEQFRVVGPDGAPQPYQCRYYHHGPWRPAVELLDLDKYR